MSNINQNQLDISHICGLAAIDDAAGEQLNGGASSWREYLSTIPFFNQNPVASTPAETTSIIPSMSPDGNANDPINNNGNGNAGDLETMSGLNNGNGGGMNNGNNNGNGGVNSGNGNGNGGGSNNGNNNGNKEIPPDILAMFPNLSN